MSGAACSAPALVMFDLDGTLVATAPEILDAVNDTLRHFALPPVDLAQVESWIGHGTRELLAKAVVAGPGADRDGPGAQGFEAMVADFALRYQQRCGTRSHLYPHVRTVLVELRRRRVKLAVVTNKEGRFTQAVLDGHGLAALFDAVVSGDSLPARKPDPAGLLHCMEAFQVPADRALFVGDSRIDVATGRNAGVAVWAVTYGYNMGRPVAEHGPDRLLDDLQPLLEAGAASRRATRPAAPGFF